MPWVIADISKEKEQVPEQKSVPITTSPSESKWQLSSDIPKQNVSDVQPSNQQEPLLKSLMFAPDRLIEDAFKGIYNFLLKSPSYYKSAKTEIPGVINAFKTDPKHALGQMGAGLAEMGQNVFNTPHDIINYISSRLHLFPQDINKMVQMGRMPSDTQQMINQQFGMPTQPGEALLRGTVRNLQPIGGIGLPLLKTTAKTALNIPRAMTKIEPEKVIKSIQSSHDILHQNAVNIFENVGKEVGKRNVGQFPLRKDLISDIADHLPKTEANKKLLDKAFSGDYQGLRDLQSDLFTEGTDYLKSGLKAERDKGREILSLRNEINESIINHLKNTGHADLAEQLTNAKKMYSNLQKTYYGKKTPAAIKNMVGENRKIPKNVMNVLSEQSKAMERIKSQNPFAKSQSKKYQNKVNAIGDLSSKYKALKAGSILGLGAIGSPVIYEKLFEKKEE